MAHFSREDALFRFVLELHFSSIVTAIGTRSNLRPLWPGNCPLTFSDVFRARKFPTGSFLWRY